MLPSTTGGAIRPFLPRFVFGLDVGVSLGSA